MRKYTESFWRRAGYSLIHSAAHDPTLALVEENMPPSHSSAATKEQLAALSRFRYALRRFLRFSEDAAHEAGITSLQYQLLVHIAGMPDREWATIGELAELLQAKPHGVVALVSRCEEAALVRRRPGRRDRREVEVHLLAKGRACLDRLAVVHLEQWQVLADAVDAAAHELPGRPRRT
jgi:DNA-binding MarR family transcriptional regulator